MQRSIWIGSQVVAKVFGFRPSPPLTTLSTVKWYQEMAQARRPARRTKENGMSSGLPQSAETPAKGADAAVPGSAGNARTVRHPDGDGTKHAGRDVAQVLKDIALFFAAPFVTMAYVALFPFIGLVMLGQALRHRKAAD
jgi:hypothetical protein